MHQTHESTETQTRASGSFAEFDPLNEVRLDPAHILEDVEEVVQVLLEPTGTGPAHYWDHAGAEWLTAVILHLLFCRNKDHGPVRPVLSDVRRFLREIAPNLETALAQMRDFDHGSPTVNAVVQEAVEAMRNKAPQERAGVHGHVIAEINLWVGLTHQAAS